jgi:hypothetical protein
MSISKSAFMLAVVALSLATASARADDLAATVANTLRDSGALTGYRVNVKAKSGTVWLEGKVSDSRQIEAAINAAENVDGVERVVNRLSIGETASSTLVDMFDMPASIRTLVGMPTLAKDEEVEEPQSEEAAAQALMVMSEQASDEIQLTGAVAPQARGQTQASRSQMRGGRAVASPRPTASAAKQGVPRPLAQQAARPMQPPQGQGRQQPAAGRQNQRMAMKASAMGAGGNGYPMEGSVADGQMVPGSMRMTEGYASGPEGMSGAIPGGIPGAPGNAGGMGGPMPMGSAGAGMPPVPMRGDGPNVPNYAWPSYAASPNYAAVQYPTQYSPTAWPYIGPFYPYPQVPLGWRRVSLEWDDGWWFLDFDDRHTHSHHR